MTKIKIRHQRHETTAEVVKTARLAAKLTQQELADNAGCTVVHLSRIENGHHEPGSELLARIYAACNAEVTISPHL